MIYERNSLFVNLLKQKREHSFTDWLSETLTHSLMTSSLTSYEDRKLELGTRITWLVDGTGMEFSRLYF